MSTMASALYVGNVRHRRYEPMQHAFVYPIFYAFLDLEELEQGKLESPLFSARRVLRPFNFCRRDYLGPHDLPLREAVLQLVAARLGTRPNGPVRLLTQVRCLGHCFNPVSFYYCYGDAGQLAAVVAEITNTPWGERYAYVLAGEQSMPLRRVMDKVFHVSPFMPMDLTYDWTINRPGRRIALHMRNFQTQTLMFDAALVLKRHDWKTSRLAQLLVRFPWNSLKTLIAIYFQALRLHLKGAPFFTHPNKIKSTMEASK